MIYSRKLKTHFGWAKLSCKNTKDCIAIVKFHQFNIITVSVSQILELITKYKYKIG